VSNLSRTISQFQHKTNNFMCKLGKSTAQMQQPLQNFLEIILLKKLLCLTGKAASKAGKTAGRRASHLETFDFCEC